MTDLVFRPDPKKTAKRVVDKGAIAVYRLKHPFCEYVFPRGTSRRGLASRWGLKCGRPMAHVHHKKFRSRGGGDVEANFESLCVEHHDLRHGLVHSR